MAERPAQLLADIKFVTIHHTATGLAQNKQDLKSQANAIERYHKDKAIANSWSAKTDGEYGYYWIEYHYLIAQDGSFLQVQDTKWMRIHAGDWSKGKDSHNQHGVAICFVGNFENDIPTVDSLKSAGFIIAELERKIKKEVKVKGHKDTSIPATACPGKNLYAKIKDIINYANNPELIEPVDPCEAKIIEATKELDKLCKEYKAERDEAVKTVADKVGIIGQLNTAIDTLDAQNQTLTDTIANYEPNCNCEGFEVLQSELEAKKKESTYYLDNYDNEKRAKENLAIELEKARKELSELSTIVADKIKTYPTSVIFKELLNRLIGR